MTKATPMYFIGLDLAFSPKNNTGIAVLSGALGLDSLTFVTSALAKSDDAILDVIGPYLVPGQTVVAVDAPLIVSNKSGMRECERAVGRMFGAKGGGAYPSHQGNMAGTRGPGLLRAMERLGLKLGTNPIMEPGEQVIHVFETYPHAAHLALFNLPKVWKYKKKPGRSWEECRSELTLYWQRLRQLMPNVIDQVLGTTDKMLGTTNQALSTADNALATALEAWLPAIMEEGNTPDVRGLRYKEFEDLTDGLFCAYSAAHVHMGLGAMLFSSLGEGSSDLTRSEAGDGFILIPSRFQG